MINTENLLVYFKVKESLLRLVNKENIKKETTISLSARTWQSKVKVRLCHHLPDCSVIFKNYFFNIKHNLLKLYFWTLCHVMVI
jgi:hypothetical protein